MMDAITEIFSPKVLIVTPFQKGDATQPENPGEAAPFVQALGLNKKIYFDFLTQPVYTNSNHSLAVMVSGVGKANAALSMGSLGFSQVVDLTHTHIFFVGIAGGPPQGCPLGSVVIPTHIVDVDLRVEVDSGLKPTPFPKPYWKLGTQDPWGNGGLDVGYECFEIDPQLWEKVCTAVKGCSLETTDALKALAKSYQTSVLVESDGNPRIGLGGVVVASDTYWVGPSSSERATYWAQKWTKGAGYRASSMEDGGYVCALKKLIAKERVDCKKILWMRSISNYDQPFEGQDILDCSRSITMGFDTSINNLRNCSIKAIIYILDLCI